MESVGIWTVAAAALGTALCTGLGALPFLLVKNINQRILGVANASAAGMMLGASLGLIVEGTHYDPLRLILGLIAGVLAINVVSRRLKDRDDGFRIGALGGRDAVQMLLIVGIMTVHSFGEGIGVGVSYGDGSHFGALISLAIAIHNIPEGIAISLVLIPRGVSILRSAGWSVFSSLPQPIMAVPAYLFVIAFRPWLPFGLGIAAGAMIWMVFSELLPEAKEDVSSPLAYSALTIAVVAMLGFQIAIGI